MSCEQMLINNNVLCGACDECGKKLFIGDNIICDNEYFNTMLGLQYCNSKCKEQAISKYPILFNLTFKYHVLKKPVTIDNLKKGVIFMIKHPIYYIL